MKWVTIGMAEFPKKGQTKIFKVGIIFYINNRYYANSHNMVST